MSTPSDGFEEALDSELKGLRNNLLSEHRRIVAGTGGVLPTRSAAAENSEDGARRLTTQHRPSILKQPRMSQHRPSGMWGDDQQDSGSTSNGQDDRRRSTVRFLENSKQELAPPEQALEFSSSGFFAPPPLLEVHHEEHDESSDDDDVGLMSEPTAAPTSYTVGTNGLLPKLSIVPAPGERSSLDSETSHRSIMCNGEEGSFKPKRLDSCDTFAESVDDDQVEHFWLRPTWFEVNSKVGKNADSRRMRTFTTQMMKNGFTLVNPDQEHDRFERCFGALVMKPDRGKRIGWDLSGFICFAYDAVMIPLQFFEVPKDGFFCFAAWVVRLYWTFDIIMTFFTGERKHDGAIDLRPGFIAKKYLRSWFIFDLLLVSLDWSELTGGFDEFAIARMGKLGKTIRMVRIVRVLRLARNLKRMAMVKWLNEQLLASHKDYLTITIGVSKIMLLTAWVTHFMGCCWYGIGAADGGSQENTWVAETVVLYDGAGDGGLCYVASFMWTLSQFTGQSNIYAVNYSEMVFSIITILFTFVVSIYAVSSITTLMTQLQMGSAKNTLQFSLLRQYLAHNSISKTLAMRIQCNVYHALREMQRHTPEETVELLSVVSDPLKIQLHYEVNSPLFIGHPFFFFYDDCYRLALQQVCHTCVSRVGLHIGDILFSSGEMPAQPFMYFLGQGQATYMRGSVNKQWAIKVGDWAAEANLWTAWTHVGLLRAHTRCTVVRLDAILFQRTTCQFLSSDADPRKYGREFVTYLNATPRVNQSDLRSESFDLAEAASKCMPATQAKLSKNSVISLPAFSVSRDRHTKVQIAGDAKVVPTASDGTEGAKSNGSDGYLNLADKRAQQSMASVRWTFMATAKKSVKSMFSEF